MEIEEGMIAEGFFFDSFEYFCLTGPVASEEFKIQEL